MLSSINESSVNTVWHKDFFDICKSRLNEKEMGLMVNELNKVVDESIENNADVVVSSFIPGSNWTNTVWDPIYSKACLYHEEHSAQFFGLLVCQVLIDRKEKWYFIKQDVAKGMIYFKKRKEVSNEIKIDDKNIKLHSLDDLKNKFN